MRCCRVAHRLLGVETPDNHEVVSCRRSLHGTALCIIIPSAFVDHVNSELGQTMNVSTSDRFPRRWFIGLPAMLAAAAATRPAAQAPAPAPTDSVRRFTSPGFLDLQVNGFAGVDFNDPATTTDEVHLAIAAMRARGVTQVLPTLISSSFAAVRTVRPHHSRGRIEGHSRPAHGRSLRLARGRCARGTPARGHGAGIDRRLRPASGSRRRSHPPGDPGAGGAGRVGAHRARASAAVCAWRSGTRRHRPNRFVKPCAPAPHSRPTSATAARRCFRGIRTFCGNNLPPMVSWRP